MLSRLRIARAVRLALVVAALLSIAGSFGLHPEPLAAGPVAGVSGLRTAGVAHGCLACLTHGAALVSPLCAVVVETDPLRPFQLVREPDLRCRHAAGRLSGRSPPARS